LKTFIKAVIVDDGSRSATCQKVKDFANNAEMAAASQEQLIK